MIPIVLKKEFALNNFFYDYPNERVFYCCQWKWPRPLFIIIRLLLALYSIYTLIHYFISTRSRRVATIVYFTTWSYILLSLHLVGAAVLSLCFYRHASSHAFSVRLQTDIHNSVSSSQPEDERTQVQKHHAEQFCPGFKDNVNKPSLERLHGGEVVTSDNLECEEENGVVTFSGFQTDKQAMNDIEKNLQDQHSSCKPLMRPDVTNLETTTKLYFRFSWYLSNIASIAAPIITVIFFTALYPLYKSKNGLDIQNTNVHILNLVFVIIDHMISARPIRLLHVLASIVYGFMYSIFSIIIWSTDKESLVLYPVILDWNNPGIPIGVVFGLAFVVMPLLQLFFFGIYQLKEYVHKKIYGCYFDDNLHEL